MGSIATTTHNYMVNLNALAGRSSVDSDKIGENFVLNLRLYP
jgi:hypothetical protein